MIRKRLFNKHYDKLLASQNAKVKPDDINTLSSVTILTSTEYSKEEDLIAVKAYFLKRKLKAYAYMITAKEIPAENESKLDFISRKQCSWFGVPKQGILIEWLRRKTDLLIAINPSDDPLIRYLIASSNSRLKASLDYGGVRDSSIDIFVNEPGVNSKSLMDQCQMIYNILEKVGVKPDIAE